MTSPLWQQLGDEIDDFYNNIDTLPIIPHTTPKEIRAHLEKTFDFSESHDLTTLLAEVKTMMRDWGLHAIHPRYFGLFNPAITKASILADALTALYNPNLAVWTHAPAAYEIERHVLRYLLERFGFDPDDGIATFTSGGAEANFSAAIAALTWKFPEYSEKGLAGLPKPPVFYVSDQSHHSLVKVAHMAGLGRHAVRAIPAGLDLKMDVAALRARIQEDKAAGFAPFMVVATAGTTSAGVIDPMTELALLVKEKNLWLHVDAAWAGAGVLSPKIKNHLQGIELADSITCDAHKWMSVSMGAGIFLLKSQKVAEDAFKINTAYMPKTTDNIAEFYVHSMQWSRRFIGLKVFMTLMEAGEDGIAERLEHMTAMGEYLRTRLKASGFIIANETPLPVVCFTHPLIRENRLSCTTVLERLYKDETAWISETKLRGEPVLRACITNFRTEKEHVDMLIEAMNALTSGSTAATPKTAGSK